MSDPIVFGFPRSTFCADRAAGAYNPFGLTPEGKRMYPQYPAFCRWRERMEALPAVRSVRAALPPHAPIEHAREWAVSHRPKY